METDQNTVTLPRGTSLKILNGDGGEFFRRKINKIPNHKDIKETLKKWNSKTYRYYLTSFRVEEVKTGREFAQIKWAQIHDSGGRGNAGTVYIYIDEAGEIETIQY